MTKRVCIVMLVLSLLAILAACDNHDNAAVVGMWTIANHEEAELYGSGMELTDDGRLLLMWTRGAVSEILETELPDAEADAYIQELEEVFALEYKVLNDTEIRIEVDSAADSIGDIAVLADSVVVNYALDGDTLIFDGVEYTRAG